MHMLKGQTWHMEAEQLQARSEVPSLLAPLLTTENSYHVWIFAIPWTIASQAPLSIEFSKQEYCSGLSFPSPGDLPNSGIKPRFLHCRQILYCLSHQGSLSGSVGKESSCNAGDPGSVPGWGKSPGEGNGNPLQYSCLENPMDRGASWAIDHGVAKNPTRLSG